MSETLEFLRLILPKSGFLCAVTIIDRQWRHKFFEDVERLTKHVEEQDSQGLEVYHACSSFIVGRMDDKNVPRHLRRLGRTHANVNRIKSLWLDIDTREGKPDAKYENRIEAYSALQKFCDASGLLRPVVVNSGYGLHTYWPLLQELEMDKWRSLANGLASLCKVHGLHVDGSRSCDPSSVLRPVGSHNRKRTVPKKVISNGMFGPYDIGELGELKESKRHSYTQIEVRGAFAGNERSDSDPSLFDSALNLYGPPPTGGEVADQCAQLASMRDTGGRLPEPEWYACLGVLATCSDGKQLAHEWSSQDPRYTRDTTDERLRRAAEFGPTSCQKFSTLNDLCTGCKLRGTITSPIQCRRPSVHNQEQPVRAVDSDPDGRSSPHNAAAKLSEKRGVGFVYDRHKGLGRESEINGGKESVFKLISKYDIRLKSVNVGESYGGSHSVTFTHDTPHEGPTEFTIDKRVLFSSSGISEVMGRGPTIHDPDLFRAYAREVIDQWHTEHKVTVSYDQLGWKDDFNAFLLGDKLYKMGGMIETVQPSTDVQYKARGLGPKKGGSLIEWSRAANELYTRGLEAHQFAVMASFAAILMRAHGDSEGGAVVAMVTSKSGTGKSTALDAVSSVWGERSSLEMTNRDTEISRAISLGVLGNLPVVLDELRFRDPETTRDFITMFTVGKDKTRATKEGHLQQNNYRWQTILIGGSNYSLVDLLGTDASNALALRVLEFSADLPFDQRKGDHLRRELVRSHGFAGDAFLKAVLQPGNIDYIRQSLPKWTTELYDSCKLTREHRFWVRTAVAVLAAAVIVNQAGILEFSVKGLKNWILDTLITKSKLDTGLMEAASPSMILGSFLSEHVLDTMTVSGPSGKGPRSDVQIIQEARRNLFVRTEIQGRLIYIDRDAFKKWCFQKGFNREEILKELCRIRVITNANMSKVLTGGTGRAGAPRPVYQIDGQHEDILGYILKDQAVLDKIVPIRRG